MVHSDDNPQVLRVGLNDSNFKIPDFDGNSDRVC